MTAQVQNLANLMRAKRASGQKFVLMLGAGASMSSGVKRTPQIMEELLQSFGQGMEGTSLEERFDQLWKTTSDSDRGTFLKPYLDVEPSPGYGKLARLIDAGYFDLAVTFNFDDLLEKALKAIQFTDYKVIIRDEIKDDEVGKLTEARDPRFKLVKMHGSLRSSNHFLFAAEEMFRYPEPIESLLKKVTGNDIIVCGYAFADHCVVRAFAEQGGSVVCVNPGGVPRDLRVFLKNRRSEGREILADFDSFVDELYGELLQASQAQPKPLLNPFKFLESYEEADSGSLMGREEETQKFFRALDRKPQIIVLAGSGRVGKTSLVKAALLPAIDSGKQHGIYLRCQPEIEKSLSRDLGRLGLGSSELDVASSLRQLGQASRDRHVVLFLDQFERVTGRYSSQTTAGRKEFSAFLGEHLFKGCNDNLTVVLVVADEGPLGAQLMQECQDQNLPASLVLCPAFDRAAVLEIIQTLAQKGEIDFEPRIVKHMLDRYEQSRVAPALDKRFTLAHIQAVCHILSSTRHVDYDTYDLAFNKTQEALNQAINVCDIISFVEDFAWPEAMWLRNIIKVPLKESKERIAEFIKAHYEELMPVSRPKARPLVPANPAILELKI